MEIKLFNSLSNKIEVFKPIKPNRVSIYVCGPTVYNSPHIGNCRPAVVFDMFRRFLTYLNYDVTYVSNFTDVDDKIINKAAELNISEKQLADHYIEEYLNILDSLNCIRANYNPRVTENMDQIIDYIKTLVDKGHAYYKNDNVYFRVDSIKDYGKLSNINLDDLIAGSRIEENKDKENPFDFVLWKKTNKGITWPSPWGEGRPGWHTECVVMIHDIFGDLIDIHGGGFDLKFPHHENEIAQCRAYCGTNLANYWMHNGFINLDNQKMSKSIGNVLRAKDFIEQHGGLLLRYTLLNCHYRAPLNITDEVLASNKKEIDKISRALNDVAKFLQLNHVNNNMFDNQQPNIDDFLETLADDLNISNALTILFNKIKEINLSLRSKNVDLNTLIRLDKELKLMLEILGLKFDIICLTEEDINLLNEYNLARASKDFNKSDYIRNILIERNLL